DGRCLVFECTDAYTTAASAAIGVSTTSPRSLCHRTFPDASSMAVTVPSSAPTTTRPPSTVRLAVLSSVGWLRVGALRDAAPVAVTGAGRPAMWVSSPIPVAACHRDRSGGAGETDTTPAC